MPLLVILWHVTRQSSIRIVTVPKKQTCEIYRLTSWVWNVLRQSYFLLQKLVDSQSVQGTISSWLHEWRHRLKNEFYFFGMETETDYFLLGFLFTDHANFGDLKLFFQRTAMKCIKSYKARAELLLCPSQLLFCHVLVSVTVVFLEH